VQPSCVLADEGLVRLLEQERVALVGEKDQAGVAAGGHDRPVQVDGLVGWVGGLGSWVPWTIRTGRSRRSANSSGLNAWKTPGTAQ
jgi:hypothetical protein